MGYWESLFINDRSSHPPLQNMLFWKQYIDYILMIWTGSETDLILFSEYINRNNFHFKFTMEYSQSEIHVLVLLVLINYNGMLNTSNFQKGIR